MRANRDGASLIEVIVAMALFGVIIGIFSSALISTRLQQRTRARQEAASLARNIIDALRHDTSLLTDCTDADPAGLAYNLGNITVRNDLATSGSQAVHVEPSAEPLTSEIDSLAVLPSRIGGDVAASANFFVSPSSPPTWQAGLALRYSDAGNYYLILLSNGNLSAVKAVAGVETVLYSMAVPSIQVNNWEQLGFTLSGNLLTIYLDGSELFNVTDSDLTSGHVGLVGRRGAVYEVDDFIITVTEGVNGSTTTYEFESDAVGKFPSGFLLNAPNGLDGFQTTVSIQTPAGMEGLKEVTVTATWGYGPNVQTEQFHTLLSAE